MQRQDSVREWLEEIDRRKAELDRRRPLTPGEVQRLRQEFLDRKSVV